MHLGAGSFWVHAENINITTILESQILSFNLIIYGIIANIVLSSKNYAIMRTNLSVHRSTTFFFDLFRSTNQTNNLA